MTSLTYARRTPAYIRPQLPDWDLPRPANREFWGHRNAKKESAMNPLIAMTKMEPRHDRKEGHMIGAAATGAPTRKVDYWVIALCVVGLAFALPTLFAAPDITVF